MLSTKPCYQSPPFLISSHKLRSIAKQARTRPSSGIKRITRIACAATNDGGEAGSEKRTFLSFEEAGLVEMSGLDTHERFLCRLTISSLNLLRVISEQEGCSIEELNAGKLCDWFVKDKLKGEQNVDSAVLQWDNPGFQL